MVILRYTYIERYLFIGAFLICLYILLGIWKDILLLIKIQQNIEELDAVHRASELTFGEARFAFPPLPTIPPSPTTLPPLIAPCTYNRSSLLLNGNRIPSGYLTSNLHAIVYGGGLGNQLFELMSLIGIADSSKRFAYLDVTSATLMTVLYESILKRYPILIERFTFLMVQKEIVNQTWFNNYGCCRYSDVRSLDNYKEVTHLKMNGAYFQSFKYFHHIRSSVREWITPHWLAIKRAQQLIPKSNYQHYKICAHVRRGDFLTDGMHLPTDVNFLMNATRYLVDKYSKTHRKITVVAMGNDEQWAKLVLTGRQDPPSDLPSPPPSLSAQSDYIRMGNRMISIIVLPTLQPEIDLAFSKEYCDTVLITAPSSTFGWWLGYLAKENSTVYYRDITQTKDKVLSELEPRDFFPPEWYKLMMNEDGKITQQ